MRVVLFDLRTDGHHIKHVEYLSKYLTRRGDYVLFVTWSYNDSISQLPIDKSNFCVKYISEEDERSTLSFGSVKRNIVSYVSIKKCIDICREWNADILHIMYMERNELPFLAASILRGDVSPMIFGTLVVPYFFRNGNDIGVLKKTYYSLNKRILRYLLGYNHLERLFTLSKMTNKRLTRKIGKIGEEKIRTVPDPVESFEYENKVESRKTLGLPKDKYILLFFGGLKHWKGPKVLLEAMLSIEASEVVLVLAGKPTHIGEEEIDNYIQNTPDNVDIIRRLGFIPEEKVSHYFVSSDIVVTPYRSSYQGTSGILQNATGAGRPVITTNAGQLGRIVQKNNLGVVVPPEEPSKLANGIDRLLNNTARLEEFRESTHTYAKEHNWKEMSRIIRDNYKKSLTD